MRSKFALGFIIAGALAGNAALAAPSQKELVDTVKGQGWFKACPQVMSKLNALEEPTDPASKEWRQYIALKAGCLTELRRDAEAITFLKGKLDKGDRDPQLLDYLGTSQFRLGKNADAVASFEEALKGDLPEAVKPDIYSKLSAAYLKQATVDGKAPDKTVTAKAEKYVRLALESDSSGNPMVYAQLATVKAVQGVYDEAIGLFNEALTKNVSYTGWHSAEMRKVMEAEFTVGMGQAYYNKGDKAQGEALMNQAIEIAPTETLKTVMRAIRDITLKPVPADQAPEIFSTPYVPLDEDV